MASSANKYDFDKSLETLPHFKEQYENKIIIAPMVRVCTLPFRLLAIDYGADLVYSEETVDWKILRSNKRYNEVLGTTDFYDQTDGTVFLRTCEKEKNKLIVQLGTSDAKRALKVAKILEPYVAGIDVNMGCPKEFSIKGGMGAALLTQPQKMKDILTTLVKGLNVPVTCKIRILPNLNDTLAMCRMIESCGVAALAVHGRRKDERPQHANHDDVISEIAKLLQIPVIANGGSKEISQFSDIKSFCDRTSTCSVMIARAAMWNCSVIRKDGVLPLDDVIMHYLKYAIEYDNQFTYTKYTIQNMLRDLQDSPRGKAFLESQSMREIASIWNLVDAYDEAHLKISKTKLSEIADQRRWSYLSRDEIEIMEIKDSNTGEVTAVHMPMQFIRGNFCNADLPKMVLNLHTKNNTLAKPKYNVYQNDRYFIGSMDINNVKYQTTCIEKNIRFAEQAAAMVYLHANRLVDATYGFMPAPGSRTYQNLASGDAEKFPRAQRQKNHANKEQFGRRHNKQLLESDSLNIHAKSSHPKCMRVCSKPACVAAENANSSEASAEKRSRSQSSSDVAEDENDCQLNCKVSKNNFNS